MSKGLKAFETTVEMFNQYANKPDDIGEFFKYTLACATVEKELKAFDIIKSKKINVFYLIICLKDMNSTLQFYNELMDELHGETLTQEEFDLLKEALA